MKRLTLIMTAMLFAAARLMAIPANPKSVDIPQPDGTTITLLMHGDEFRHFMTTSDGFTVVKGEDGFYRYADKGADGQLKATTIVARNVDERDNSQLSFLANRKKMISPEMTLYQKEMRGRVLQMQRDYTSLDKRKNRAGNIWDPIDYSNFKGLVILVEFSDRKFSLDDPKSFYQRLTNEKNLHDTSREYYPVDVTGSARDYLLILIFFLN